MMNTGPGKTDGAGVPPTAETKQKKKRNWLRWTIFGVCVFVVVLAVVLSVVPKYAARHLMETELANIGIKTTGSETLYVNLWRGEVRMGPVEFWSEGAERGQVGMVGARLSLATLFKKRALIETFFIEEVDIVIEKKDDGIFVNGISLQQFMTAEEQPEPEPEQEEGKPSWGAGIDKFEFRNSKMILKNFVEDDELEIDIEYLFVTLFHTWQPDEAGVVNLRGTLAGAPLFFDATASPFADDIKFRFEAGVADVQISRALDYGRIAVFFEKDMFTRREGVASTTLSFSGFLFENGSIEMNGEQKATITDLHLVTAEGLSFQLANATLALRSAESYVPGGRIDVAGEFTSAVEGLELGTPEGQTVRLDSVQTHTDNFFAEVNPDKSIHAAAPHSSLVKGLHVAADSETAVDLAEVAFGIETLTFDQSPEGAMDVAAAIKIALEQIVARSGSDTRVEVQTASIASGELAVKQVPEGSMRVTANPTVTLASTQLRGAATGSVDQISIALSSLVAEMAGDAVSVQTAGSTNVSSVQLTAPGAEGQPGADVSVAAVRVDLQNLTTNMAGGDIEVNGTIDSEIARLAASVPQPGGAMTVTADQVRTSLPTLNAQVSGGATSVRTTGSANMTAFKLMAPGTEGQPGTDASVQSARVDLQNLTTNMAGGDIEVNGGIGSEIAGLAASIAQPGGAMTVAADQVQASFPTLNAQVSGGATTANLAGKTTVTGFKTNMPSVDGRPEITVGLGSLDVAMREIAASVEGEAPKWKVQADVAVRKVATQLKTAESASTVDVASVDVTGVKTDQALAVAIGAIVAAGIDADLVDKDLKAFGGGETKKGSANASTSKGPEPTVRLDRLAVGEQSVVKFTDTSVDPPVIVVVDLDEVTVKNIDTGNPSKRTDIKLDATINESSTLAVSGWATPLKSTPDFSLDVNLKALPLPAYSSYVSNAIGWNLDGGDFSTTVNATASNNALKGQVGVLVDNLFLNPVTAADGEKLEKQIGVPVQFAVGILKDDQGRINLDLPLSGTVAKPEVDYSSVIRKAISGFLGSIFGSDSFQGGDGFQLKPVVFAPGSAVLDEAGKQSAEQYVTMLAKKSTLKLGVCGRANVQDFVALFGSKALPPSQPVMPGTTAAQLAPPAAAAPATISSSQAKAMVELAMERTNVVRAYFVDERGINTDRIVQCRVTYDIKDTQPPRAQFAM